LQEQLQPKPRVGWLKPVTPLQHLVLFGQHYAQLFPEACKQTETSSRQKRLLCLFHEPVEEAKMGQIQFDQFAFAFGSSIGFALGSQCQLTAM